MFFGVWALKPLYPYVEYLSVCRITLAADWLRTA